MTLTPTATKSNHARLYYINKKTSVKERLHDTTYRDLRLIKRANNITKSLQKVARTLAVNYADMIKKSPHGTIFVTHSFITGITEVGGRQNNNLHKQLAEIFNITYHHSVIHNGKKQRNGFIVFFQENGEEILNNPGDVNLTKPEKNFHLNRKKFPVKWKKISTSIYKEKEYPLEGITELPKEAQVIPQREINKEKGKNNELAFEHFEGAQANSHEIKENDKPCLTAEQEKDHYALHQSRNSSTEPETGFNTIMDTIANLNLPTENRKESIKTTENLQKTEDIQLKVESLPQISWHAVKKILSAKQKFYRLDNVVVTESLRKITISHQYTSALDLIDRDLGIHLKNIAEEFNIQIILLNQQDTEVVRYDPGKQKYEVTADDLKYMKSLRGNEFSAIDSSPFPELVERLEEFIATGKIEEISNE